MLNLLSFGVSSVKVVIVSFLTGFFASTSPPCSTLFLHGLFIMLFGRICWGIWVHHGLYSILATPNRAHHKKMGNTFKCWDSSFLSYITKVGMSFDLGWGGLVWFLSISYDWSLLSTHRCIFLLPLYRQYVCGSWIMHHLYLPPLFWMGLSYILVMASQ